MQARHIAEAVVLTVLVGVYVWTTSGLPTSACELTPLMPKELVPATPFLPTCAPKHQRQKFMPADLGHD